MDLDDYLFLFFALKKGLFFSVAIPNLCNFKYIIK